MKTHFMFNTRFLKIVHVKPECLLIISQGKNRALINIFNLCNLNIIRKTYANVCEYIF